MSSASVSDLLDALDTGARLLLPNARAARELRRAYDARQSLRGLAAWEPPQMLSWPQWTSSLWSELVVDGTESRLLLNATQEQSLWREILTKDAEDDSFASVDSLAELARSTWQLAAGYKALHRLREFATTRDSRVFTGWAETFSDRCDARGCVSAALLEDALLQHVKAGTLAAPDSLELVGFNEWKPSQEALLDGLRERGTVILARPLEAAETCERLRVSVVAADERDELLLAARWIREFLDTPRAKERGGRVAVLVPNLTKERAELEEVLRETLAPELQTVGADLSSTPWEFSGGVPLASVAMVDDALALVRWADKALPLERVSPLLLSPYFGRNGTDNEERDAAARFDAGVSRQTLLLQPEIEIGPLLKLAEQVQRDVRRKPAAESMLLAWLRDVQRYLQRNDRSRLRGFAEWMEFVRGLTRAASWPGDRELTASEFEATRAWESVLDSVSTLDFSGRRVAFAEAMQALGGQAKRAAFALPSTGAPVQVMSFAEAEGSLFDAVVLLRSTDANLPPVERGNPLLPWALQRSLKMPGSDAVGTAAKGRASIEDLMRRSGDVLFTYAAENGSGKLRPSPLLEELQIERVDAASIVPVAQAAAPLAFEHCTDDSKLPELPSHEVGGGATVLKLQAACGFLAFANMRLLAAEPSSTGMGLDARESGTLLHRALQYFWQTVESQEALRLKSWAERDTILARCIDDALPRKLEIRDGWDREYLAIQKERLRSVLHAWLEVELQRGPFTVLAVEQKQEVTVGPLTLEVRMDRIDRVGEGFFLVDYKTGFAGDPKQWDGERLDEPQLPLYALLGEPDELKGLAFAKVRTGREMKWAGYQSEEGILSASGSKQHVENIFARVEQWRRTLDQLAKDFAAGRADVRPKSFEVNCARCAQRLLCRVDPRSLRMTAEDAEDVEGIDG